MSSSPASPSLVPVVTSFPSCLPPQIQHLGCDDICVRVTELYESERPHGATGGALCTAAQRVPAEAAYQRRAELLLTDENCFKVVMVSANVAGGVRALRRQIVIRIIQ